LNCLSVNGLLSSGRLPQFCTRLTAVGADLWGFKTEFESSKKQGH
jgi:hypothetical protein